MSKLSDDLKSYRRKMLSDFALEQLIQKAENLERQNDLLTDKCLDLECELKHCGYIHGA